MYKPTSTHIHTHAHNINVKIYITRNFHKKIQEKLNFEDTHVQK